MPSFRFIRRQLRWRGRFVGNAKLAQGTRDDSKRQLLTSVDRLPDPFVHIRRDGHFDYHACQYGATLSKDEIVGLYLESKRCSEA